MEKTVSPIIISHIKTNDLSGKPICQSNEDHSRGVSELARIFASEFGMGDWGHVMGMLHDKGKEKAEFQNHIRFRNGLCNKINYTHEGKAHAYVGGLLAKKLYPQAYSLISNPIMGHHRGLYDYIDLEPEYQKAIPNEVEIPNASNLSLPSWFNSSNVKPNDFHHIERMLFSCLVDADYLDTEKFMQPEQYLLRGCQTPIETLLAKLETYLDKFGNPTTQVNKIRAQVQQQCRKKARGDSGFYSLTVPTGGGKTLSSLVWAMNHAVANGKKRIIIAIPYTSIIVQTADVLREIFGQENVLEHHSNVVAHEGNNYEKAQQLKLATENWDYPIIVTTNVQLFESMMASHSSSCRKLHNICNSVLILDEVQTLPTDFLQPIVDSLDTYQRLFGVSVLFTTASQPVLKGQHQGTNPSIIFNGLNHIEEIIPKDWNLHGQLRRVQLNINDTPQSYDSIAQQLAQHDQVLCIVNTRRDANELFDRLPEEGIRIHLSRMMCPAHVSVQIQKMKEAISNPQNKIVRVVSTQLIEAGVDIDFPVVYRQEAGLDSVLQAAGRCNREGKLPICTTHVFSLGQVHALPRGFITRCNNARINMGKEHDWFSPDTMNKYFRQLYSRLDGFDKKDMAHYLGNINELMFETAEKEFRLIDENTTSVVVNWQNSLSLVEQLKTEGPSYNLVKQLSLYSVNLRQHDFEQMQNEGIIEPIIEGFYVARGKKQYDENIGLLTDNQWLEETFIV